MSQQTAASAAAPATMRAVVVTRPGGLGALEIKDVPVPVRKPGWVRIRVKAFGVNESEVTPREGESDAVVTYPRVPGIEGVGVVDEAGEGSELRPGQQVATMMGGMGRTYDGAYAQYVTVPAAQVIPFETGVPWDAVHHPQPGQGRGTAGRGRRPYWSCWAARSSPTPSAPSAGTARSASPEPWRASGRSPMSPVHDPQRGCG